MPVLRGVIRHVATYYTTPRKYCREQALTFSPRTDTIPWIMKKDIHPTNYRPVVFEDLNNGFKFLTRSTVATEETTKWEDGNDYPLVKVHITSSFAPLLYG
jgi:large subunit ribosomal protein L31